MSRLEGARKWAVKAMLKRALTGDEAGVDRALAWAMDIIPPSDEEYEALLDGAVRATRVLKSNE